VTDHDATLVPATPDEPAPTAPTESAQPDRRRLPIALYPALLAATLVFELLNVSGASPFAAGRAMLVAIGAALLLAWLGRVLLGDRDRGGVFAALWVLALLGSEDVRLGWVIVLATGLLLAERYLLSAAKRTIRWPRIGRIASRLTVVLTIAIIIQGLQLGAVDSIARAITHETPLRPTTPPAAPTSTDPDIYMVLLDGYARADVLSSVFGHDGMPFVERLEADGFQVAPKSRSNYTQTGETLSSMFSQAHLKDIPRMAALLEQREVRPPGGIVRDVINDNETWRFLRDRGYEIDAVSSGFEQVVVREADRYVDTGQLNEFEIAVLKRSLVGHVLEAVAPDAVSAQQRDRIDGVLDAFATAPEWIGDGPQFVFAHVPSPHPPWVFNADGSARTVGFREEWLADTPASTGLSIEELKAGYVAQVTDIDRRFEERLTEFDAAIAARGRPAVVIVFSDHGSWIGADGGDIRLRFKDLLAVRGTGTDVVVEPNQTLVNLLPNVFDQLFATGWTRRADTQYRFGAESAFELHEVDDPDASATP
jgi:hypothetical protein